MPVLRPHGTSVRERVAAIEKKELVVVGKAIENTVIRAKYEPDVRGVNRFRHFHTPIPVGDVTPNGFGKDSAMTAATHLPSLVNPTSQQVLYKGKDAENGMEKGARRKKKDVSLPQLNNVQKQTTRSRRADASMKNSAIMEELSRSKTSSESDSSLKLSYSGVRLKDALAVHHKSIGPKRTFASLDSRQNGVIINRPLKNSLEVALPPRSKSAQDLDGRADSKAEISPLPTSDSFVLTSSRSSKDMATQTSKKHVSTASVEFLNVNCVRSTQTESTPIVINSRRKSDIPPSLQDIEEREALLEVIEDALGETFDRYSRVRTNQIIANSARKQAQIWRDVKDFLGCNLFPSAIQMANKSTSRSKTAAEIVASIKMYP
ncbi:hypothetical protein CRE_15341 [Caenorhabditis remanei]|uniref:Uncharacterized protein n=2 Tax=Caenorhabditis remanei TaxID=31234 RepID=E3MCC6_CAERE|nr:hypothetical protein CRE_15341 [Caenorhabditis remanei]